MPVDAAFEQLRRANPEPDPAALRRHLRETTKSTPTIATRSETMDTRTSTNQARPPTKPRRRWLPALVAGVLVLFLGIPVLIVRNGGSVFGLFEASPLEVAERYIAARNAYDPEAARAVLADDVVMNDTPIIADLGELSPGFEALRRYEFQFSPYECSQIAAGPPARVVCNYMMTTNLQRIVGYPPIAGGFNFTISDGRITNLIHSFNFSEFGPNAYDSFLTWLDAAHPGGFDQLFRIVDGVSTPRLTPEALDLISVYVAEFDQATNG
jgi:hypothetical protein